MNSFVQFVLRDSFRTLPDGKRVFLKTGFLKPTYLLIPNAILEHTLRNKVLWVNTLSLLVSIGGIFIVGYFTDTNFIVIYLFLFFWWVLSRTLRFFIVKKDISDLQKLNIKYETTFFYDNFTNKVEVGKNDIPQDYEISKYLDVPNSDDKILFLSYKDLSPLILRCALGGWIIWQAELKSKFNGILVSMEWYNEKIRVLSETAESILLDPNTGSIVENK